MDVIRVRAPSTADAQRLIASIDGRFAASLNGGIPSAEVELRVDLSSRLKLRQDRVAVQV